MIPEHGRASDGRRTVLLGWLILGVLTAVLLQVYFSYNWAHYLQSISAVRLRQLASVPAPSIASTPLSALHGTLALLIVGAIAVLLRRSVTWKPCFVFAAAVALTHVAVWLWQEGLGNLWPLAIAAIAVLSGGAAFAGSALMTIVLRNRARDDKRHDE